MKNDERRQQYACDITYINNELGFDYLRDNMVICQGAARTERACYCIIDEVDSVLIDEEEHPDYFRTEQQIQLLYETAGYSGTPDAARRGKRRDDQDDHVIMGEEIEETGDFIANE